MPSMPTGPDAITIRRPDDWHVHFRDGAMLRTVLPWTARQFARAIVMPNLVPPVTDIASARGYRERIVAAVPSGVEFTPLMTCYLTDATDPAEVARGHEEGVFIDRVLDPLCRRLPELRIVLEHVTTEDAVAYVESSGPNLAATITAHHLIINRNAIFQGGIRPHLYCLPIAKREKHRCALRRAATSGRRAFFLGTDSAPHAIPTKETACGCAGVFTAASALELYAEVFAQDGALDKFEAFASLNGPAFYRLPIT